MKQKTMWQRRDCNEAVRTISGTGMHLVCYVCPLPSLVTSKCLGLVYLGGASWILNINMALLLYSKLSVVNWATFITL